MISTDLAYGVEAVSGAQVFVYSMLISLLVQNCTEAVFKLASAKRKG